MTLLDPLRERETLSAGDRDLDDRPLRAHLAALRRADADEEAPAAVEQALLGAWDRMHRARAPRLPVRLAASAAAMAAAVVLGVALTVGRDDPGAPSGPAVAETPARDVVLPATAAPPPRENPQPSFERRGSPGARRAAAPGPTARAVVLVGSPITPGEPIHLVRMRVARETLLEMGLRPVSGTGDGPVDVEMLVGEDGVARGLRVTM